MLDLLPPPDLPATLASVDDVRRVCEAVDDAKLGEITCARAELPQEDR